SPFRCIYLTERERTLLRLLAGGSIICRTFVRFLLASAKRVKAKNGRERMATNVPTPGKKAKLDGKPRGKAPPLTKGLQAKARIIAVAEALFTKQGIDGASMREIAAAAKMQPASMYYYFESKHELVWAVWEKGGLEL